MKPVFLVYSLVVSCCGWFLSLFIAPKRDLYVFGSNYGCNFDHNLISMASYIKNKDCKVVVVGDYAFDGDNEVIKVQRGSLESAIYFFSSTACFYTHSLSDVIPYGHKFAFLFRVARAPILIFLQHGVLGLKSELANGVSIKKYLLSLEPTFDYMVVSSEEEKKVVNSMGVPSNKLAITGLPRFDKYSIGVEGDGNVLIFFTWQDEHLLGAKLREVSESDVINELKSNGYKCHFLLHDMQSDYGQKQKAPKSNFNSLINECNLLITDDSSIAWDMFYRKKEVIFYKPSNNWLLRKDFLSERRCFDEKDLYHMISVYIQTKRLGDEVNFTKFHDSKNCQRVFQLITIR